MTEEIATPSYGTSDYYLGEMGHAYFAAQSGGGLFGAQINAHKFRDFIRPTDTVLDFGCGGDFLLKTLNCTRRIGVEINPAARECASQLGVECYADAREIPDGIADVVISDHALEHVPFPIGALSELRAKLKPGGLLRLVVPIDNWRLQRRYDPQEWNHHLHTWTPLLMGHTLAEVGYEVLDVHARIFAWPGNWTVACYGRLPYWLFCLVCHAYGCLKGYGWEVLALVRNSSSALL